MKKVLSENRFIEEVVKITSRKEDIFLLLRELDSMGYTFTRLQVINRISRINKKFGKTVLRMPMRNSLPCRIDYEHPLEERDIKKLYDDMDYLNNL